MARVLIVDDARDLRLALGALLRAAEHVVDEAERGDTALAAFSKRRPDVVVIDVDLPDLRGIELARKMLAHKPRIPVILMTASPSLESASAAVRLRAVDYLVKPVAGPDLLRAVNSALETNDAPGPSNSADLEYAEQLERLVDERTEKLHAINARLFATVEGVARTMASIVELREGKDQGSHQHRVALLARAIAKEVRLPLERIPGVYLAAMVHDIGVLQVPMDVIHKCGPLTVDEFELVKLHPRTAYDFLTQIPFDWPVADIALQHHECPDGSGYPEGLKGAEILPEASILHVADEVESMLSNRPYRPARSLAFVLDELSRLSGTRYEAKAAKACADLLRSGRFTLD